MGDHFTIRRAKIEDAPVIADFNRAMAWETEQKQLEPGTILAGVQQLITNPQYGFYIVSEVKEQPVACLLITYEWSDWRNGLFWWIQSVYVKPEFRQRGIYKQMYTYIKNLAHTDRRVCGLRLYVADTNQQAQMAYRRLGMDATHYRIFEEIFG